MLILINQLVSYHQYLSFFILSLIDPRTDKFQLQKKKQFKKNTFSVPLALDYYLFNRRTQT